MDGLPRSLRPSSCICRGGLSRSLRPSVFGREAPPLRGFYNFQRGIKDAVRSFRRVDAGAVAWPRLLQPAAPRLRPRKSQEGVVGAGFSPAPPVSPISTAVSRISRGQHCSAISCSARPSADTPLARRRVLCAQDSCKCTTRPDLQNHRRAAGGRRTIAARCEARIFVEPQMTFAS
jgi:hypothetical protein